MEEFIQNFQISNMQYNFTQFSSSFKFSKTMLEKKISNILKELNESGIDKEVIDTSKEQLSEIKEEFLNDIEENGKNLRTMKAKALRMKEFFKSEKEEKEKKAEEIFQTFIFEYLYKFEKLGTSNFLENFKNLKAVKNGLEFSKYNLFKQIINDLKEKKMDRALDWCRHNRSALKKQNSNIEYRLLANKVINFIKTNKSDSFILAYIQENLSQSTSDTDELFFCLNLMLTRPNKILIPSYLSIDSITQIFHQIFFDIEGFDQNFFFENLLHIGIKCLKTSFCKPKKISEGEECPCCSKWIHELGEDIKLMPKTISRVKCPISDKVLDDKSISIIMPDDRVYSLEGVSVISEGNNGIFRSVFNKKDYSLDDHKRIYFI